MNHWKDELDGIAGDFSEEKEKLSSGINRKLNKKLSKKSTKIGAVVSLIVAVIGIFIYQWSTEPSFNKAYSSEAPVYLDEKMFKYYQTMMRDINDVHERDKEAFSAIINFLALEHYVNESGNVYTNEQYDEALQDAISRLMGELNPSEEELLSSAAELVKMSKVRYIKTVAAQIEAKTYLINKNIHFDDYFDYIDILYSFGRQYESEILALAKVLNVEYPKLFNESVYKGLVVATEGSSILVVDGATFVDIQSMQSINIPHKYNTGVWFQVDKLQETFLVGDQVIVYYNVIESSLPAKASAVNVELIRRVNKPAVYYDENLFQYFILYFSHLKDEAVRKAEAFEMYIEWLAMEEDAYFLGYLLDESKYALIKAEVLQEFETSIGNPPINREDIEELALKEHKPIDYFIHNVIAQSEIHQRLIHEWNDGAAVVPYGHPRITSFKNRYKEELNELGQKFGTTFYPAEIPYYIAKVVEKNNDGQILTVNGNTVEDVLNMNQDQIMQKYDTGIWFNASPSPRVSVGDVVKIHYDATELPTSVSPSINPIKITIIKDVK